VTRLERSFASRDGEHGIVIERAVSPDSKFFVFSGYSSGGYQSWVVESGFEMVAPVDS